MFFAAIPQPQNRAFQFRFKTKGEKSTQVGGFC